MAGHDFRAQRLFVADDLREGASITPDREQTRYLLTVLRMRTGAPILLFNGRDGEWRGLLEITGRNRALVRVDRRLRQQTPASDLVYCFAPLKRARLDYMVQKAVEMGAGRLQPVWTDFTQAQRLNEDRMWANAIEAAEQCGILSVPEIAKPSRLPALLSDWPGERMLVFCDELARPADLSALRELKGKPIALLVGPEGGFSQIEREKLHALPFVRPISLGPRILRADTAAVAGLAMLQFFAGDWIA